jgi:hypothetical protein
VASSEAVTDGFGWAGTAAELLTTPRDVWLAALDAHCRELWGMGPAGTQRQAWVDEHAAMTAALRSCCEALPDEAPHWGVVFEYELPLEGGRRPDVVVLAGRTLVVLEFKSSVLPSQSEVDQLRGYVRDLGDYHAASHDLPAVGILVLTGAAPGWAKPYGDTILAAPEALDRYLFEHRTEGRVDLDAWLHAPYSPLPTLVEAARRIFRHEPLPHVTTALSVGIPQTVELLGRLCEQAHEHGGRLMAFVTGVPGAGKTLVGLRLVYERSETLGRATFLSGNGPLVAVLQDALRSRVFVRDIHAFIRTHAISSRRRVPEEHVIVFDEAQRAWDRRYMHTKRGVEASEPELLVGIGERIPGWSALVGLVGEGQEIHSGEEAGVDQWRLALDSEHAQDHWTIHCPPKLAEVFDGHPTHTHDELDLTVSLRSRRARDLHQWVGLLLEGSIALAARVAVRVQDAGFPMWLTRDLDEARDYARGRYVEEPGKRFGLVASSHAKVLARFGVDNGYMATSRMNIARWFNAPPDDPLASNALTQPVTEFGCQGLELDLPVVCWGEDFRWHHGAWDLTPIRRRYRQDDPEQLLRNAYRVLLTRGRDGVIVWIPPLPLLDETETILLAAGVRPIPEPEQLAAPAAAM